MAAPPLRTAILTALTAVGALIVLNTTLKPTKTQSIAGAMRQDLDVYNSHVGGVEDDVNTLFDRKKIMADVKTRKPWNMSQADKGMRDRSH